MGIWVDDSEPFHVLLGSQAVEMSLAVLDEAYQDDIVNDATLIWQEGLGEWLRLDVVLERLAEQENLERAQVSLAPALPPETYFVLTAPDEVKQMTLEQLDDAYRLDIIDDGTLVWQPGFASWIPLASLLGEDAPAAAPQAPAMAPQAPAVPASIYPAPSPAASAPLSSTAAVTTSWAPGPASTWPLAVSTIPDIPEPERASPWFKRSLLGLAAAAGLLVLHQNGVTQGLTAGLGAESLQHASIATPAGVESWLERVTAQYDLDKLSRTEPVPQAKSAALAAAAPEQAEEKATAAAPEAPAQPETPAQAAPAAEAPAASAQSPASASGALPGLDATKFGNTLQGKKPVAPAPVKAKKKTTSGGYKAPKVGSSSGDAYDPMNGSL